MKIKSFYKNILKKIIINTYNFFFYKIINFIIKKKKIINKKIKNILNKTIFLFISIQLSIWLLIKIIENIIQIFLIKINLYNNATYIYICILLYSIFLILIIKYLFTFKKKYLNIKFKKKNNNYIYNFFIFILLLIISYKKIIKLIKKIKKYY